ncbi:MAG: hypothetical protein ACRDNX_12490, partial [Gaiellaceae bacterium]
MVGALGAVLVLLAGSRAALLGGFGLLAAAEAGLGASIAAPGDLGLTLGPAALALGVAGAALLAAGTAALVRWPALVTPLVLGAAPFRLPLDFDGGNRFLVTLAEPGELGRLLPLYAVLAVAALALAVRLVRGAEPAALPRFVSVPAAAFTAFAAVSLLWSSDLEAGTGILAFFLLPFATLVAVVGRAPFPAWLPRALAAIAVGLAAVFAAVGLWQAATRQLLFFTPNLEVANTYAPIFRVTSLFRDPSLYGRHVVLGVAVVVVLLWLGRLQPVVAAALIGLLWAGIYLSYSQSSLIALFVAVLAVSAAAGDRTVRRVVATAAAGLLV